MRNVRKRLRGNKEFSQCIVIVSWAVTIVWITLSFILAFYGKDTNSEVTVALITESFGVTLAYFLYQACLKISRNRHGIDSDGVPYAIKQRMGNVLPSDPIETFDPEDTGL